MSLLNYLIYYQLKKNDLKNHGKNRGSARPIVVNGEIDLAGQDFADNCAFKNMEIPQITDNAKPT